MPVDGLISGPELRALIEGRRLSFSASGPEHQLSFCRDGLVRRHAGRVIIPQAYVILESRVEIDQATFEFIRRDGALFARIQTPYLPLTEGPVVSNEQAAC